MRAPRKLLDATDTVPLGDAGAVAEATERILAQCFGAGSFDRELLHASFALADRLFAGRHPGFLACDMPYHDLRHSLDTALVMARFVAGYQIAEPDASRGFGPDFGLLGVVLGLLHDVGYIRRSSEAALCGPHLAAEHEERSAEFAASYLATTSLASHAPLAALIVATKLGPAPVELFARHDERAVTLGQMLGSADLVCQMADRDYLERCYYHLYPELVIGGCDRVRGPDGEEQILYHDALDLIARTPKFYEHVVRKRLDHDFEQVSRYLAAYFADVDPYAAGIARNLERAARIVAEGRPSLLGPEPVTTTPDLAGAYRARPGDAAPKVQP